MNAIRRFGLVVLAGVLLAGTVACSDNTRVRNAAVPAAWSCNNGSFGIFYQVAKADGGIGIYRYTKKVDAAGNPIVGSDGKPQWVTGLVASVEGIPSQHVLNALSLTPSGVMYAALTPDGSANNPRHELVRINPPANGSNTVTYDKIADYPTTNASRSVNSGTYVEVGGNPVLLMGFNTKPINSEAYDLNSNTFSSWITSKQGSVVKDVVWLRNPITYKGISYDLVGIDQNTGHNTVLFNSSGQSVEVNTQFIDAPSNFNINANSQAFGVGGSYGSPGGTDWSYFTRNDGFMFRWEWDDANGQGKMFYRGPSTPSRDNDGASCGPIPLDPEDPGITAPTTTTTAAPTTTTTTTTTVPPTTTTTVPPVTTTTTPPTTTTTVPSTTTTTTPPTTTTTVPPTTTTTTPPTTTTTVPPVTVGATSCSTNPTGLVQQYNINGVVYFKKLDVAVGDYADFDPAVSLDLTGLGFGSSAKLNATAIDEASGKIFGAISDNSNSWLVQFDLTSPSPTVAFLGKMPVTSTGGQWAGTITSAGTYIANYGTSGLLEIPNVSSLVTFNDSTSAAGVSLGVVYDTTEYGPAGDITTVTLSDGTEAIVGYNNSTDKMVISPVNDLANPISYATDLPGGFSISSDTLGAAWTSDGDAYFSRNNGGGLFVVKTKNIDTANASLMVQATSITQTEVTSSNDGFGCAGVGDVPDTFDPVVNVMVACSTEYKGSYTVSIDNSTSSVDATVELEVAGTVTSVTVPAGETYTSTATLANDATVTATATNAAFAETSVSDTATLSDCIHVVDPRITVMLECSETYEGTASYTIDNSGSTLDVAVSYFIDGVETTRAALVAGGTIGVVDIPISNGSTITVIAAAESYPPVSVSDSLTGCVAPDVFVPTVAVELTCTDGTGNYLVTIDNSKSNVDATVTVTVDGGAVGDPVTVAAGETQELNGSIASGQEVVATASSTGQTAVSDNDLLEGCVQIQVFGPSLSVSTACSADGTGSYSATVDNTSSDMDVNVVVGIDGVNGEPIVVAAGGTETLTGTIDNNSTVTVTASAGDDITSVSAALTDCTPPPTTTTTTPPTTTTTTPPTTTTTTPPPASTTTTTVISQLPATGPGPGGQTLPWFAVTFLLLGAASAIAARRGAARNPKDSL